MTPTCLSRSAARSCWKGRLLICAALCVLIWNGIDEWSKGVHVQGVHRSLVLDDVVNLDPAADGVGVALAVIPESADTHIP